VGNQIQLRLGYVASDRNVNLETGSPLLPQLAATDAGVIATGIFDTRDTAFNATRGVVASFEYVKSDGTFGAQRNWQRMESGIGFAVPFNNDVLWIDAAGGSNLSSALPPDRLFTLGGPVSLPGYDLDELRAAAYWTISGGYLWQIKDLFALRGQTLYAGVRIRDLKAYDILDSKNYGQIQSVALFITGRTPVGPLTLGFATTTENSRSLWISFGRPTTEAGVLSRGLFR
jgi:outer membrane protein assembly factor BamA